MLFSSLVFLFYFLPIFLVIYELLPKNIALKNSFIVISSIVFYSWGGPKFIFVILGVTLLDFLLVQQIFKHVSNKRKARLFLIASLSVNVGLLFYFKYCNFFIENVNELATLAGGSPIPALSVILPIGISFYTFESITYSVDVYRGLHRPVARFRDYLLYILFFPKLIAGPIVRYHEISDQLTGHVATENTKEKLNGFLQFCIGLGKKVLIANVIGSQVDVIFSKNTADINSAAAWLGAIGYTFQIYFDFSGYTDMALGLGRMMGFRLPENFNNPYTATSITNFWQRWHITLGAWMRNYIYIPLGGNRVAKGRLLLNLMIVFLVSGLWHGASWNFVIWGAMHGLFLILDRLFLLKVLEKIGRIPATVLTFFIVVVSWVIFRLEDLGHAGRYLSRMFAFDFDRAGSVVTQPDFNLMMYVAAFFSFCTLIPPIRAFHDRVFYYRLSKLELYFIPVLVVAAYGLSLIHIAGASFNPFIYFRF